MKTFEQVKDFIISEATRKKACNSELSKVKLSTNFDEILIVIKNNISWISSNNLFENEPINNLFSQEKLIEFGVANLGIGNTGFCNTGSWNTGSWNTGNRNTGSCNTGSRNTGDWNTGDCNTGSWNTGNRNTGSWNTGNRNTGSWNTGSWNTGEWNTGDWNTGDCNTGDWNTGDCNTGVFNTITPKILLFNQISDWGINEWYKSKAYTLSLRFILTKWVSESEMTVQEKIDNPKFHIQEGYLKRYEYKEACDIWWNKLTQIEKESFKELPNFDEDIFFEITGCKF
jgi:hypothetical protein